MTMLIDERYYYAIMSEYHNARAKYIYGMHITLCDVMWAEFRHHAARDDNYAAHYRKLIAQDAE